MRLNGIDINSNKTEFRLSATLLIRMEENKLNNLSRDFDPIFDIRNPSKHFVSSSSVFFENPNYVSKKTSIKPNKIKKQTVLF